MCRQDGVEKKAGSGDSDGFKEDSWCRHSTHQRALLAARSHIGKQRLCNTKQLQHGRAVFCFGASTAGSHLPISDVHQLSLHVTEKSWLQVNLSKHLRPSEHKYQQRSAYAPNVPQHRMLSTQC